mmetsp:Transcript_27814/g.31883  ORF Transcript_27814/g.31883 Transcript_27814/m.31883 type:complete len:91 (-) Transcript_27814:606-878(-)
MIYNLSAWHVPPHSQPEPQRKFCFLQWHLFSLQIILPLAFALQLHLLLPHFMFCELDVALYDGPCRSLMCAVAKDMISNFFQLKLSLFFT